MSFLANKEIICTHCQLPNDAEVWTIVNVRQDPELKDLLMGGELNMMECTSCKKIFFAEDFLLYHDPDTELLAFVYPYECRTERELYEKKTREDFSTSQNLTGDSKPLSYGPITMFGLDELLAVLEWDTEAEIQADIVTCMASEHGFLVKRLHTAFSRAHKIPPILPYNSNAGTDEREQVLAALMEINKENNLLSLYVNAREYISKDSAMIFRYKELETV